MALVDSFLPALAFASLLAREPEMRDVPYATAREDMEGLIEQALAACRENRPGEVQDALFAVCAFADEAVLSSEWPGRTEWLKKPLQRTRFATANAGEEFYVRLAALCDKASGVIPAGDEFSYDDGVGGLMGDAGGRSCLREVLEVYAACLTLGFTGRYYDSQGRDTLAGITRASLKRLLAGSPALGEHVFPETYAERPEAPPPSKLRPVLSLLALFGLPLLAAVCIHAAYASLLTASVREWLKALT